MFRGISLAFSRAAFSSASRRAAASTPPPPVDLDLSSPGRSRPVVFDDDAPDEISAPRDPSASATPLNQDVLPPASALSPAQQAFRRDLFVTLQSAVEVSAASGTARTCEATLRNIVPKVTLKLVSQVLPIATEARRYAYFGAVFILGPESASPASAPVEGSLEIRETC